MGKLIKKENAHLKDLMEKGELLTLLEIKYIKEWVEIDEWRYFQLKHFVTSLPQPIRSGENLLQLEELCVVRKVKSGISQVYKILPELAGSGRLPFIEKWEKELGTRINDVQLKIIIKLVFCLAVDTNTIKMNYKCLSRCI